MWKKSLINLLIVFYMKKKKFLCCCTRVQERSHGIDIDTRLWNLWAKCPDPVCSNISSNAFLIDTFFCLHYVYFLLISLFPFSLSFVSQAKLFKTPPVLETLFLSQEDSPHIFWAQFHFHKDDWPELYWLFWMIVWATSYLPYVSLLEIHNLIIYRIYHPVSYCYWCALGDQLK